MFNRKKVKRLEAEKAYLEFVVECCTMATSQIRTEKSVLQSTIAELQRKLSETEVQLIHVQSKYLGLAAKLEAGTYFPKNQFENSKEGKKSNEVKMPKLSDVKEPKIGEKYLTANGDIVECVEYLSCCGCYFMTGKPLKNKECKGSRCSQNLRKDKKPVIFRKVKLKKEK